MDGFPPDRTTTLPPPPKVPDMKLCWLHPTTRTDALEPLWAKLEASIRPTLRPDTQVEFRFMPRSGNFTRSLYAEHLKGTSKDCA